MSVPVFIGGCERSGTTFLASLLGSHPQAVTLPESVFKLVLLKTTTVEALEVASLNILLKKHHKFAHLGINETDLQERLKSLELRSAQEIINSVVDLYAEGKGRKNYNFWIDHNPNNLQNCKLLSDAFPNAKFIHLVRDGRAIANSVINLDWGPNTTLHAAQWWLQKLCHGLLSEQWLGSKRIMRVKYEDLVRKPQETLQTISEFIGLDYSQRMTTGDSSFVAGYTKNQHSLVGRPADLSRVNKWEQQLSPQEIQVFEKYTGQTLELMGYQLNFPEENIKLKISDRLRLNLKDGWRKMVVNPIANRKRKAKGN